MKKFIRAAKEYSGVTLEFRTPDLEVAKLVTDKAWKIGGFGSTGSETSNATVYVPASQDVSKIEELIDFAQDNGAFLNLQSARKLESFGFELGDIDAACGKKSVRATSKPAPKKAVKADELYPENYNDLGYEGLDDAVDALKRAIENAKVMLSTLEGIADEYDEWGGSTPTIEMFAGPDDAIDFAEEMNKIADKLYDLDLYCPAP